MTDNGPPVSFGGTDICPSHISGGCTPPLICAPGSYASSFSDYPGEGVRAKQTIPRGAFLVPYHGRFMRTEPTDSEIDERYLYMFKETKKNKATSTAW